MKKFTTTSLVMLTMLCGAMLTPGCSAAQKESIVRVSNEVFASKMNQPDVILLDVRTPEEFQASRLEGAMLINIGDRATFLSKIKELDKAKKILVYCRSGNRSMTAANLLVENGFTEIYELRNGILGWNGPVISGKNK
jgi:rhodanese-related sulfurtransferase